MLVRFAGMQGGTAAGTWSIFVVRHDNQRAGFASERSGGHSPRDKGPARHIPSAPAVERVPDRLPIQRRVCPDDHDRQREKGINAGVQLDLDQIAELHVGNEDAQHKDLDHRPGGETLDPYEYPPKMPRRICFTDAQQHVHGADQLRQRRDNGNEHHHDGEARHPAPHQFHRAGEVSPHRARCPMC